MDLHAKALFVWRSHGGVGFKQGDSLKERNARGEDPFKLFVVSFIKVGIRLALNARQGVTEKLQVILTFFAVFIIQG